MPNNGADSLHLVIAVQYRSALVVESDKTRGTKTSLCCACKAGRGTVHVDHLHHFPYDAMI